MAKGRKESADFKQAQRALTEAEQAYSARCRQAESALENARRTHDQHLRDARKKLNQAEQTYEAAVSAASRRAELARAGNLEASYGDVLLYPDRLETPEGTVPLDAAVRATVEATGTKTEKSDSRETVLLLDTPSFDSVVRVKPDETTRARELAAKINTAAKNATVRKDEQAARVAAAERDLARVRAERGEIDRARAQLEDAEADTESISVATQAFEEAKATTRELDAARARLLAIDPQASVRATEELQKTPLLAVLRTVWRKRSRRARIAIIVVVLIAGLTAIGALAGDPNEESTVARESSEASLVDLDLDTPTQRMLTIRSPKQHLSGRVTPGASVRVNGETVRVVDGAFEKEVPLALGENRLLIRATKAGSNPSEVALSITRELPSVTLRVEAPSRAFVTVRVPRFRIEGIASRGAILRLDGRRLELRGIRFAVTVALRQGENTFEIEALKKNHEPEEMQLTIVRRLSASEIAANQARAREQFIARARTIPYNQLIKNPEAYAGSRVKYYGEILQIQESAGIGFMLLYVTHHGYDIWGDQIWVNYRGHVRGAQGDQLTVYGVVVGTKSYETQIGGETFVPEIDAKYIVE